MLKKLSAIALSATILLSSLGVNNFKIYADSNNLQPVIEETIVPKEVPECNSVPKAAAKRALKWAIKNTTTITNLVGKHFGKESALKIGKYMHKYIKPALNKLDRLDSVTYGAIEKGIKSSLTGAVGPSSAQAMTNAIMFVIEVLAPI